MNFETRYEVINGIFNCTTTSHPCVDIVGDAFARLAGTSFLQLNASLAKVQRHALEGPGTSETVVPDQPEHSAGELIDLVVVDDSIQEVVQDLA